MVVFNSHLPFTEPHFFQSKSPVAYRYTPQQVDYRPSLNQSYTKGHEQKENTDPMKNRMMAPGHFRASTAADSRYQLE